MSTEPATPQDDVVEKVKEYAEWCKEVWDDEIGDEWSEYQGKIAEEFPEIAEAFLSLHEENRKLAMFIELVTGITVDHATGLTNIEEENIRLREENDTLKEMLRLEGKIFSPHPHYDK